MPFGSDWRLLAGSEISLYSIGRLDTAAKSCVIGDQLKYKLVDGAQVRFSNQEMEIWDSYIVFYNLSFFFVRFHFSLLALCQ
jgi:hypothetical protein